MKPKPVADENQDRCGADCSRRAYSLYYCGGNVKDILVKTTSGEPVGTYFKI